MIPKRLLLNLFSNVAIFTLIGFFNGTVNSFVPNFNSLIGFVIVGAIHGLLLSLVEFGLNRTNKKLNSRGMIAEVTALVLSMLIGGVVGQVSGLGFETFARLMLLNGVFRICFLLFLELSQPVVKEQQQQTNKQKAFITGCGRALPGVDRLKGKGALVDGQILMDELLACGIHNPVTGKPVSGDFAQRNLGLKHLPIADLVDFQAGFPAYKNTENAESIGEWDLSIEAARQAMENAGIQAKDLDAIIHVSPTIHFIGGVEKEQRGKSWGLQNAMRKYPEYLPGLRPDCLIQHHDSGCSGVLVPFRVAKPMLASGEYKQILVVCSLICPRAETDFWAKKNELDIWVNYLLFGDAASAFILTGSDDVSKVLDQTRDRICYELGNISSSTKPDFYIAEQLNETSVDEKGKLTINLGMRLNPHAAKKVFVQELYEWLASENLEDDQIDALLLHQPNTVVIKYVEGRFGKKVLNIAEEFGNLVPCSLGVQFYEQLVKNTRLKNGNNIVGFTLGAHVGMTCGGFTARVHADDQHTTKSKSQ